jgi:hypothetical protein
VTFTSSLIDILIYVFLNYPRSSVTKIAKIFVMVKI